MVTCKGRRKQVWDLDKDTALGPLELPPLDLSAYSKNTAHLSLVPTPISEGSTHPFTCGEILLPLLGSAGSVEQCLPLGCQTTNWLTSILEDCEHPPSFHLKLSSSCHLCSVKPLLPRPWVTLELKERETVCRRSFCKRNCNAEKARYWPEEEKRWCCGKTGGWSRDSVLRWHIQSPDIFKMIYSSPAIQNVAHQALSRHHHLDWWNQTTPERQPEKSGEITELLLSNLWDRNPAV